MRKFLGNKKGLSAMQDAILFMVMVSISGAILLPAFTNDSLTKSQMEREKDEMADEALLVLLATTEDEFNYVLGKTIIEEAFGGLTVDLSKSKQFGEDILNWITGRTEYHKSYGELIAECLACQIMLPIGDKNVKANILTKNFEEQLEKNISQRLKIILGEKYAFNFSARWYPIMGIPFGGEICIGSPPPNNAYVAQTWITIPYVPEIEISGEKEILTPEILKSEIEKNEFYKNTIGLLDTFPKSDEEWKELERNLTENITNLMYGILFTGLGDMKSILEIALDMIFESLEKMLKKTVKDFEQTVGEPIMGIMDILFKKIGETIFQQLGEKPPETESMEEYVEKLIEAIKNYFLNGVVKNVNQLLRPLHDSMENMIKEMVRYILDLIKSGVEKINEIKEQIFDWTINRIRITKAEVRLSIWEV